MKKFFFVTYCFGDYQGQSLIGVYKRGLRVALELANRGHEIVFFCTGREAFQDDLTRHAERTFTFIDIPFEVAAFEDAARGRRRFLQEITAIDPDIIVVGEAPLSGAMLETALCGVELGIPVAILDNAYNPAMVEAFLQQVGTIADGCVLTGPSSHHLPDSPPHVRQVPPLVDADPHAARALVEDLGLQPDRLVTVLGYDAKVQQVGLALARSLIDVGAQMVFVSRDSDPRKAVLERVGGDGEVAARGIGIQEEHVLFGLLALSRLAIVKYGFMQVTECLSLHTPVVAVYHEGPTWLDFLPEVGRRFAYVTRRADADQTTVATAIRFFQQPSSQMQEVHDGRWDAKAQAADFLEALPHEPRTVPLPQTLGMPAERVLAALRRIHRKGDIELRTMRAMRLRETPGYDLYVLTIGFDHDGEQAAERLWIRRYRSRGLARRDRIAAATTQRWRRLLSYSAPDRLMIESALGEAVLPVLNP